MELRATPPILLVLALALLTTACRGPEGTGARDSQEEWVLQGQRTYEMHCAGCHGLGGKGDGPAAAFLNPPPRDFTAATFKFRTTPSSFLPTDEDLFRTITHGVRNTSMPSWRMLSEGERRALVQYLKSFAPERWADSSYLAPSVPLPGAPGYFSRRPLNEPEMVAERERTRTAAIAAGARIYLAQGCVNCHGTDGSLRGATNRDLRDYKERHIVPLNFSRRAPKGGTNPEDYYRAFTTGLDGTPMPIYGDTLTTEERWQLVAFVMALKEYGGLDGMLAKAATRVLVPPELKERHQKAATGGE